MDVVHSHTAEADDKDPYLISFRWGGWGVDRRGGVRDRGVRGGGVRGLRHLWVCLFGCGEWKGRTNKGTNEPRRAEGGRGSNWC